MLSEYKHITLHDKSHRHAEISILGTCELEVTIIEDQKTLKAGFNEVSFSCCNEETDLVCKDHLNAQSEQVLWHLELEADDATELEHIMEEVSNEFEMLMNDL